MLLLLDLDGTLIHDRGYRTGIDATVTRYCQRNDLPVFTPSDDDVFLLHAHGFSNEWDSVAFLAGIIHHHQLLITNYQPAPSRPDFQSWTRQTAEFTGLPNERARAVLLRAAPQSLHPTIHTLLDHVTEVDRAPATRIFAELILGSALFTQHYGLPAELGVQSLLEQLDEPLIDQASHDFICAQQSCVYTARPSLPPDGHAPVHPPEAEIGLKLLKLEHLPMIALGHMQWLADQYGERVYDLTKPAPVQALAAMLAAQGHDEAASLLAAYKLWKRDEWSAEFESLRDHNVARDVVVVEDNAGGVRSCHAAAALLQQHGVAVRVRGLGISASLAKRAVLEPVCERVFDNVNAALQTL